LGAKSKKVGDPGSNPGSPILLNLQNLIMKTRKVKSAGRFRAGYGTRVKVRIAEIESKQKKKQTCPYCKKQALKRLSKGIWKCKKCNKKFSSGAYYLE